MKNGLRKKVMEIEDVLKMTAWGKNENALLSAYDFWPRTYEECAYWHREKTKSRFNSYYVYYLGDTVIAYVSAKGMDRENGVATLGIVLDPNYQSKGYGEIILKDFLQSYFDDWGFKVMVLHVDSFNSRAIKLYRKVGFKTVRRAYCMADIKKENVPAELRKSFVFLSNFVLSKNYVMEVTACDLSREKI